MGLGIGNANGNSFIKIPPGTPAPSFSNLYSMDFINANSEYLQGSGVPLLTQGSTGEWSFSVWVKVAALTSNNRRILAIGVGGTGGPGQTLFSINTSNSLQISGPFFHTYDWVTNAPGNGSTANIINNWINVIYRVRTTPSGNNVGFVINGTITNNKTKTVPTTYNDTGTFYIGRNAGGGYFDGSMDEVAIFNSYLSDAQCIELYNSGTPTDLSASSMAGVMQCWWRMGDPTGPSLYPTIPATTGSITLTMNNMLSTNIQTDVP